MTWNANEEKLRCMLVLSDAYAGLVSHRAGLAFFRAFIVEDRASGEVWMKFLFRYKDPDERRWSQVRPKKKDRDEAVKWLVRAMTHVVSTAAAKLDHKLPPDALEAFYPPDDGGDPGRTLIWLEMSNLIELIAVESEQPHERGAPGD
jgi:hypothetical protein